MRFYKTYTWLFMVKKGNIFQKYCTVAKNDRNVLNVLLNELLKQHNGTSYGTKNVQKEHDLNDVTALETFTRFHLFV